MEARKLLKENKFWIASFLIAWAAALQVQKLLLLRHLTSHTQALKFWGFCVILNFYYLSVINWVVEVKLGTFMSFRGT